MMIAVNSLSALQALKRQIDVALLDLEAKPDKRNHGHLAGLRDAMDILIREFIEDWLVVTPSDDYHLWSRRWDARITLGGVRYTGVLGGDPANDVSAEAPGVRAVMTHRATETLHVILGLPLTNGDTLARDGVRWRTEADRESAGGER